MEKKSLSDKRVLKQFDASHEIRPFLLQSVGECNAPSVTEDDCSSEKPEKDQELYNSGYTDGLNAGRLQILGDIESEFHLLRKLMEGIESLRAEIFGKIEEDVVAMSLLIAKKIIYEVTEKERGIAIAAAREAIRKASDRESLRIRINPVDYDILNKKRGELLRCIDGIKSIVFEADESMLPGGCLIETNHGDVDARVDSQFRVIEGELRSQASDVGSWE